MNIIEILFGVAFPLLITLGISISLANSSATEFWFARIFFILAALDLFGLAIYWSYTNGPSYGRLIISGFIGAILLPLLTGVFFWIDYKEKQSQKIESTNLPKTDPPPSAISSESGNLTAFGNLVKDNAGGGITTQSGTLTAVGNTILNSPAADTAKTPVSDNERKQFDASVLRIAPLLSGFIASQQGFSFDEINASSPNEILRKAAEKETEIMRIYHRQFKPDVDFIADVGSRLNIISSQEKTLMDYPTNFLGIEGIGRTLSILAGKIAADGNNPDNFLPPAIHLKNINGGTVEDIDVETDTGSGVFIDGSQNAHYGRIRARVKSKGHGQGSTPETRKKNEQPSSDKPKE